MKRASLLRLVIMLLLLVVATAPTSPLAAFSGALAPAAAAPGCGGTFVAAADTFVNEGAPANVYGASTQLLVGDGTRGEQHTLLAFNFERLLPPGATIQRAELLLTIADTQPPAAFEIALRETAGAWNETTTSWNTRPPLGARYGAARYSPQDGTLRVDVTPLAIRWFTGAISNTGVALLPVDSDAAITFVSRNAGAGISPDAPKLLVSCAPIDTPAGIDQAQADQRQLAGIAMLKQRSRIPAQVQLTRGALSFAFLDLPIPQSAGVDPLAKARWFLGEHRAALRVADPDRQFQLLRRSEDWQLFVFRQLHNGIPVFAATLKIQLDGERVRGVGGSYLPEIVTPSTPRLSARQAEILAAALLGDGSVRPGDRPTRLGDGSVRPAIAGDTQLRYLNRGLLGMAGDATHLTWRVSLIGTNGPVTLFIDALNGALRYKQSHVAPDFDLEYLSTADNETSSSCWVFEDTEEWFDEDGVISGASPDAEGFTAFNNIKATYNYWNNRFGRDSYDDDGEEIEMYIHVAMNNARYIGGICDIFEYGNGFPQRDVVGHEFTHAVDRSEGDLEYVNQSGALDESFADIFGHFIDSDDWLLGEGTPLASAPNSGVPGCSLTPSLRDMSNPPCQNDPDHMQASKSGDGTGLRTLPAGTDPDCDPGGNDCGFVHTNSGIHNKVASLLVDGGTHPGSGVVVQGIGKTKAERLFYNLLTGWLGGNSSFMDARNGAYVKAGMLLGNGTFTLNDLCQVNNAYAAVGLGQVDTDCDGTADNQDSDNDNDSVLDGPDNCNNIANPGQADLDGDGIGDACDNDIDGDTVANGPDNCDYVANVDQADWNSDGQGDRCDDSDQDTVKDSTDNCRTTANADQKNTDGDSQGDACDGDDDNDGVPDTTDNCQLTYNPDQKDSDGDGIGDACDKCPGLAHPDNTDTDNDGLGNPCDSDDDNDGIPDGDDICPLEVGLGCLEQGPFFDDDVFIGFLSRFPIPHCIVCGEVLPPGQEVVVELSLPVGFQARIVDSEGMAVARGKSLMGGKVTLTFEAPSFAGPAVASHTALDVAPSDAPAPDERRYYLELTPAPGVDTSVPYRLKVAVEERIEGALYAPLIAR